VIDGAVDLERIEIDDDKDTVLATFRLVDDRNIQDRNRFCSEV